MMSYRSPGSCLTRQAARTSLATPIQEPPRRTRSADASPLPEPVRPVLVGAPLPHVPQHVMKAPAVGPLQSHRPRAAPHELVLLLRPTPTCPSPPRARTPPRSSRRTRRSRPAPVRCARPGSPGPPRRSPPVVPARHAYSHWASEGSESTRPSSLSIQAAPGTSGNRPSSPARPGAIGRAEVARVLAHHRLPQLLRAGRLEHPEARPDRHLALWAFVVVAAGLVSRASPSGTGPAGSSGGAG